MLSYRFPMQPKERARAQQHYTDMARIAELESALDRCARIAEAIDRRGEPCVPPDLRDATARDIYEVARAAAAGLARPAR